MFVAASMHAIEWCNNSEVRTTYIVVCGCQTRRSPCETEHAGWTFCFTAELPKVKTPCVTNTPQGVEPFFFLMLLNMWSGLDFFSDPQPSAAFELLLLVTMFVKWPTFILGKFRRGLCSTVAVQGYLDCSRSFTSQMIYQNPAQIQPLLALGPTTDTVTFFPPPAFPCHLYTAFSITSAVCALLCRQQHCLHRGSGSPESPAAHV